MDFAFRMLRGLGRLQRLGSTRLNRPLTTTISKNGLFQNLKEAYQKESEKEGIDAEIAKLKKNIDEDAKKFAESEKFKKIKK